MAFPVAAALAARSAGTLGLGLSGGGFIIPFMLGVVQMLYVELGVLKYSMPVAGASTGSIVATAASGLVTVSQMQNTVANTCELCRGKGNCFGVLQSEVRTALDPLLPATAADQANRQGNLYVAVTYPTPLGAEPAEVKLIGQFAGKSDLLDALGSSTYIPYWGGPLLTTKFRGVDVYDGSMGGNGPGFLPCPPNVSYCVRVSSMPAGVPLSTLIQTILSSHDNTAYTAEVLAATAATADKPTIITGVAAARVSAGAETKASEPGRMAQLIKALGSVTTPGEGEADIWPGRRHPLPVGSFKWMAWMISPPTESERKTMFDLGRAEALSWAQEAGFPEAAGKSVPAPSGGGQQPQAAATSVSMSG